MEISVFQNLEKLKSLISDTKNYFLSAEYSPFREYHPKVANPPTTIGIKIKTMMLPKTKSSCLPEVIFGIPRTVNPR